MRSVLKKLYYADIKPILPSVLDEIIWMTIRLGYVPNVRQPRTFNEKIAHRKLFTADPRFSKLSDKWAVRAYVRERVGSEYLIAVHQCVTSTSDIDLGSLPNEFVIKATHDSGSVVIVDDKSKHDWGMTFKRLNMRLQDSFGVMANEYWYNDIPRRLIIEERIRDERYDVPLDFKFFVFHSSVRVVQVIQRFGRKSQRFYDRSWNPLSVQRPRAFVADLMAPPRQLERMIEIAERLAEGFDFVRVDLYAPNDERVLFGEMTFAPGAGRTPFIPRAFDWELGSYW